MKLFQNQLFYSLPFKDKDEADLFATAMGKWLNDLAFKKRYVQAWQKNKKWYYHLKSKNGNVLPYDVQGFERKATMLKTIYASFSPAVHIEFLPSKKK